MAETIVEVAASAIELGGNGSAPRRVKLLPLGEVKMRDGRGPYYVRDLAHAARIIDSTRQFLGTLDMSFDYGHAAQTDEAFVAAGWAKLDSLKAEPDGIYATVEWTPAATQKIAAREYRYLSPLFFADKSGNVLALKNVALVNIAAIDMPAVAAGVRMGVKYENGETRPLSLHELKALADGTAEDMLSALTPTEWQQCRQLGWDVATYLKVKIQQLEEGETVAAAVTRDEAHICAVMGVSQSDFLAVRNGVAMEIAAAVRGGLSKDEVAICALMGVSTAQYLATKNKR